MARLRIGTKQCVHQTVHAQLPENAHAAGRSPSDDEPHTGPAAGTGSSAQVSGAIEVTLPGSTSTTPGPGSQELPPDTTSIPGGQLAPQPDDRTRAWREHERHSKPFERGLTRRRPGFPAHHPPPSGEVSCRHPTRHHGHQHSPGRCLSRSDPMSANCCLREATAAQVVTLSVRRMRNRPAAAGRCSLHFLLPSTACAQAGTEPKSAMVEADAARWACYLFLAGEAAAALGPQPRAGGAGDGAQAAAIECPGLVSVVDGSRPGRRRGGLCRIILACLKLQSR